MEDFLVSIVFQYPKATAILSGLYLVSLLNKAVFSAVRTYVQSTDDKKDDEMLAKIEGHKAYKAFAYALDLVARIKLPLKR